MAKEWFTEEEKIYIKDAYEEYQKNTDWTFHNERELTETTLHNRFNFLLLAYSLFINSYFMISVDNVRDKLTILIIGSIIILLLSIGNFRSYIRFIILLNIVLSLNDKGATAIVEKEYKKKKIIYAIFPRTIIIGLIVPIVMLTSFIFGIIFNIICY